MEGKHCWNKYTSKILRDYSLKILLRGEEVSTVSYKNTRLNILFGQLFWKLLKAICTNCGKENSCPNTHNSIYTKGMEELQEADGV